MCGCETLTPEDYRLAQLVGPWAGPASSHLRLGRGCEPFAPGVSRGGQYLVKRDDRSPLSSATDTQLSEQARGGRRAVSRD